MKMRLLAATLLLVVGLPMTAGSAAGIDVAGSPDLDVVLPDDTVEPGQETELTLQLVNQGGVITGGESNRDLVTTARNVVVTVERDHTPITVETERYPAGSVDDSSPVEVPVDITVPQDASPGTYDIQVETAYKYTNTVTEEGGINSQNELSGFDQFEVDVTITDDAQFSVEEVDSTLRIGEEGRITGRLENTGGSVARNTEIEFTPSNENINALSSSVAVGDIPADGSAPFSIPVEVTSNAEAVPHRFDLNVNYRDENGISQNTDDPEFLADIGGQRDAFLVEPTNRSIQAGGSRPLDLRVTNNLDETVTDIEGKFFADDPLDSTNDETFTGSLDPGETTTVTVDLSASGGATIKNYPASVDFRYVDSEGESKLTDSYRMAISVTEPETNGGPPVGPLIGLLVVLAGVGYLGWRRGLLDRFTG